MTNTRETMGEQACLDALVADTLTTFEDDGVVYVGANALQYHDALTSVTMSQCKSVNSYGLANCTDLEVVDIQGTGTIVSNAFNGDTKLKHVVLRGNTKTDLDNTNAFNNTPISIGEGAIYVPSTLVESYKSTTNWSKFIILPIDAYPSTDFSTISDSWSDIITAVGNGTYGSKYTVGDTKSIVIDGTTYYMQLVAKDADVLASDGTTTVATTWLMFKVLYGTTHVMNSTQTTEGGWASSEMRSWLSGTVLPLLPAEVRTAIKEVRKYSGTYENGAVVKDGSVTADKLWIPSFHELNMGTDHETQGATYSTSLYPSGTASSTRPYRVKYNQSGSGSNWWLRSAHSATAFRSILNGGGVNITPADTTSYCVVLGFCI